MVCLFVLEIAGNGNILRPADASIYQFQQAIAWTNASWLLDVLSGKRFGWT